MAACFFFTSALEGATEAAGGAASETAASRIVSSIDRVTPAIAAF
jgi:hypothetical protein